MPSTASGKFTATAPNVTWLTEELFAVEDKGKGRLVPPEMGRAQAIRHVLLHGHVRGERHGRDVHPLAGPLTAHDLHTQQPAGGNGVGHLLYLSVDAHVGDRLRPELVQLWYQMALNARRDLPMAPSARAGFEMAVLRMLAFRPSAQAGTTAAAPAPATAARGGKAAAWSVLAHAFAPQRAMIPPARLLCPARAVYN